MKKSENKKDTISIKLGKKKKLKLKTTTTKKKDSKDKDVEVVPYREIEFSDGAGFFIKTAVNLTSDNRVQVTQYREHADPEGMKFVCTEPNYFEDKNAFLDWLLEMLKKNFDEIPYITIKPLKGPEIKKQERETVDTMYG
ncbi:MAG: hypothetical protein KAJ51_16815 [Thermoplasmata archaeon]|nr:hypothetical protein [Thermoplasmata archaeon]